MAYTTAQSRAMKKMSPARRRAFKKMLARSPSIDSVRPRRRKRATPNRKKKTTRKKTRKKTTRKRKRKLTKAEKRKIAMRNLRKAHKKRGTKMRRGRQARTYGKRKSKKTGRKTGGYKALRARYGPRTRWTYKYATKKGHVRDIPDHALLGYPSAAALKEVYRSGSDAERRRLSRRLQKLYERRERDAERSAARIRAGRGVFTPNADDVLSYEEWEEMRPNRRRKTTKKKRKSSKRPRYGTKAYYAYIGRKGAAKRKRKSSTRKKKRSTKKRKSSKRPRYGTKAYYSYIGKKGAAKRKRRKSGSTSKRRTTKRRRSKKVTGKKLVVYVSNRRRKRRTKRRRSYRRNQGAYAVNRGYRSNRRRRRRRSYRRNQGYMSELSSALKLGAFVTVGFATHRVLTHALDEYGLSRIAALNTGMLGQYRGVISGLITAAVGIGAAMMLPLRNAKAPIAAGMGASFIHGALITALNAANAGQAAQYLSNYPNAEGKAYGSYYTFQPHEVYAGYGSYYEIPQPMNGFGQQPLMQAAAGMGQPLMQAAAGMGQPQLTQAAAGMGQITQAAAGTGEYVAWGVQGVGEYEEMPVSGQAMYTDEGIHPNLHSAEQALSVAEAAAGVGSPEVPLQSTVDPTMIADPVSNLPRGSRSGVFQGGDGIFG